ncbi:MAG: hypothetical protein JWM80_3079 [Cyanobacteria bacterium RYN_339]|nr:hypothetical protein [Cyanobacteria bacterium RYN_339]
MLSSLLALLLTGCAHAPMATPMPAAEPRMMGAVQPDGWHGPWLPTMDTLSVPSLDFANPFKAAESRDYLAKHPGWDDGLPKDVVALLKNKPLGAAALARWDAATRGRVLDSLSAIAQKPLAPGLDRADLLNDLLAELEVPARVTQGLKWTCESASVQILLAERNPAEYARLVAGLASADGKVKLADGAAIARVPDWASKTDAWRSWPSRLLQPAFATYGNGPLGYDNTHDRNSLGASGLTDPQVVKLASSVFGRPFAALTPDNSTAAQRMGWYRAGLDAGWHPIVWVEWSSGHVVVGEPDRKQRVVIDNPFGAVHSLTPTAFQDNLHSVYLPVEVKQD